MEESIQRKDAAIKGLEKETETLQRQLTSVSYDYNELRESLRKESGELDSSRQLRQLENKLASLSNELEHACQKSNNQSLIVKQLNVSLFEREHELAKVRESLAVLEASEKNKEESSQAKALLASVQLIWEELGVSLQSRDSARRMIESCLEDTCNRILEDARALRNDCDRRLKIFSNRLEFVSSALGIDLYEHFGDLSVGKTAPLPPKLNDYKKKLRNYRNVSTSSLQIVTGHSENQTPLLQRLNDYGNILKQLQPRYEAAKERRDRLALDLKNILKSIASLEDMLSINLKKLLNDVREGSTGDGNFYGQMESMYGIPSMERIAEDKNQDEEKDVGTIPDWEKFTCTLDDLEFLENTALHADLANSLSDAFLDECENDLKHLRLKKREILIRNNDICDKSRLVVEEMHVLPKEIFDICRRQLKKRSHQLPDWWDTSVATAVCEALCQKELVVGVSESYTNHLQLISEFLQHISDSRKSFANAIRNIIEHAHNVLLSTLENDTDAKEAYTSFHEALFRLPKISKDHIQACIDELNVLVNATEAVIESETEALTVVWDALDILASDRDLFWAKLEEELSSSNDSSVSLFDDVFSSGYTDLEEWISAAAKNALKMNSLLKAKLLKLERIHREVEDKRDKQDLQGKIIMLDSEIRLISAKLAEFEEMAGNTQRLVTKKINSSNFLKEERFRKNVQSKFASKLEVLGKLLQQWQKKKA